MALLTSPTGQPTCHGCKHCWYSAPGGQLPLKPYPHSRCTALAVDVPMVLGPHEKWLGSEIPDNCPMRAEAPSR
jgi:hypothetical protein